MVCKLAQIPPEIWMALPLEDEKWILNERKRHQQVDDKMKKSLALSKSTAVPNHKETNNANIPIQNARVKNVAKGEDVIKDNTDQTYAFADEFLEEAMKSSSIYEADEDVDYEYWSSNHNAHVTISITNSLHNKCINLLHLPEKYHISILDGCADTCVLGKGWEVLSVHNTRRANVVGYDNEAAEKRNLPIVSAIPAVDLPDGISVILIVHEAIYNDTANHSLLSEFQLRDFRVKVDSICHKHGGTQKTEIQDVGSLLVVSLELAGCKIYFEHRLPTTEEINSLKQYCLTKDDTPWNPSSFSDQVADKFCQQVIDKEQKNSLNTKSDYSSDIKVDLVEQDIPKLSYFDPSDDHDIHVKGNHANLLFHLDTLVMKNTHDMNQLNKDSFYSKVLTTKIDYEKISPYFAFRPHDVIQHTLRQTIQLAKCTIHYHMRLHLKSFFQMLRHKRLNEVIATDTYFANNNQ
jgi:hypothetical protein